MLTPTFRYHPSIVAQAFGTLGAMFPGRVILGIGTGESLNEVPSTGEPWPEFKERFARLREAVTLIRKLWREERVTFEGEYYKTEKATIYDRPDDEVPIYVAAAGALVAKYAGRKGDGFICTSGKKRELYTETLLPNVAEGIALAGERKQHYDRMIEIKVSFDTDKERALQDTRHWAALALTPEEKMSVEDPVEMQRLADALPLERAASRWIVSNDPDELIENIGDYVELGFNHLVSTRPARTRHASSSCSPRRSCRGCASGSAESSQARAAGHPRPADGEGRRRSGRADRRGIARRAGRSPATCWCWRRRSSPRPRAAWSSSRPSRRRSARSSWPPRSEGPAAGRADPFGIGAGRALPAEPADRPA